MKEPLSNAADSIVILGAGPAGLTAALYARRSGMPALVLEKLSPGGQMNVTPEIENYPGVLSASGFELGDLMRRQAEAAGAEIINAEVRGIDLSGNKPVLDTAKGRVDCGALILAMGATPSKLGAPGEDSFAGRGVSYCATCDGFFFRGKTVAVVGGGNTALEDALYLAGLCEMVHLIHRRDEFRGDAALAGQVCATPNIRLRLSRTVEEIRGSAKVESLCLRSVKDGGSEELPVDALFVAVGITPVSGLVTGQLPLDQSGYILAGEDTRTPHPAVFAAGDLRKKELRQVVTAAADGAVAATAAARFLREGR